MRRIFEIRHAESAANIDKNLHRILPDHAVPLTHNGLWQATQAGVFLDKYLASHQIRPKWKDPIGFLKNSPNKVRFWQSPYLRTRMTGEIIRSSMDPRRVLDTKEHIMLVEQQFGLYDGLSDEECASLYPSENAHYMKHKNYKGRFWATHPLGESRFAVAQRVYQTFETFHRDCDEHGIEDIVVVSHGTALRCFHMMWLKLPYEWMETEPNPRNCSIRLIENDIDKGYIFEGF